MKSSYSAVLLMAGNSTRFNKLLNSYKNKSLYELNNKPLLLYSLEKFNKIDKINNIYIVVKPDEKELVETILEETGNIHVKIVEGGSTRNKSVKNALKFVEDDYVLFHDVARPLTNINDIKELIEKTNLCGTLYHNLTDTVKETKSDKVRHLERSTLKAVTTPQIFHSSLFDIILNNNEDVTDELTLFENCDITFIEETSTNMKVTTFEDFEYMIYLLNKDQKFKVGHSYDYHNFKDGEKLILGGIEIPSTFGLEGYSDSDVIYHSVCESILGALELGDIGTIFPDNAKENYKRNSLDFVNYALEKLEESDYEINNIDIMIYLQKPNLKNYKQKIVKNLKQVLKTESVNVKATTLEKQGLIGTSKGIGTETVVLIRKK